MKAAAIYARVSSEQQKEENTIASQTAALIEFAREQGYGVPDEWVVEDAHEAAPACCGRVWSGCAILPPRATFRLS